MGGAGAARAWAGPPSLPWSNRPPGSTTTCSCGSPQTCFPPLPPLHPRPAAQMPRASGTTASRCASLPSSWVGGMLRWVPGAGADPPPPPGLLATRLLDLALDSDSDDEDTHFSAGASGAPQPLARESRNPRSQSTFSALVTVLKGRITAHCETKVRTAQGQGPPTPEPLAGKPGLCERLRVRNVGNRSPTEVQVWPAQPLAPTCPPDPPMPPHPFHHTPSAAY